MDGVGEPARMYWDIETTKVTVTAVAALFSAAGAGAAWFSAATSAKASAAARSEAADLQKERDADRTEIRDARLADRLGRQPWIVPVRRPTVPGVLEFTIKNVGAYAAWVTIAENLDPPSGRDYETFPPFTVGPLDRDEETVVRIDNYDLYGPRPADPGSQGAAERHGLRAPLAFVFRPRGLEVQEAKATFASWHWDAAPDWELAFEE